MRFPFTLILLKSIAAVYVSLYLILPACMCQLLGAFGYDIHVESAAIDTQPLPTLSEAVIYVAPICHCEDDIVKTAEAVTSEPFDIGNGKRLFAIIDASRVQEVAGGIRADHGSRAPPGASVWSCPSHSGVFRI